MSTSHRRPVKQNLLSSSPSASLRDTLKNRCMDRMRAARRDRHTATRVSAADRSTMHTLTPANTDAAEMDFETASNQDPPFNVSNSARAIRRMMQSEWGALVASVPLDPDMAEQIEREMLQELSDMDNLHRIQGNQPGLNVRPSDYDQSLADEYEADESAMFEHDVETHLPETASCACPSCHQGLLLVLQEKPFYLFGCSLCSLRVQSRVPQGQWMQSLQGHAANHATICSGQVVFVNQEEVGHFLACTGCDYFTGI
ncbi:hypothetical protein HDU81_004507 [Chytriomyces hyalinus]|nr:hypothetical protein HDU81_004507 [Chytriomyces hyalinus]